MEGLDYKVIDIECKNCSVEKLILMLYSNIVFLAKG